MNAPFIHRACMCCAHVHLPGGGAGGGVVRKVAGESRPTEECFRKVMCGRGSEQWGTLREEWEGHRTQ